MRYLFRSYKTLLFAYELYTLVIHHDLFQYNIYLFVWSIMLRIELTTKRHFPQKKKKYLFLNRVFIADFLKGETTQQGALWPFKAFEYSVVFFLFSLLFSRFLLLFSHLNLLCFKIMENGTYCCVDSFFSLLAAVGLHVHLCVHVSTCICYKLSF